MNPTDTSPDLSTLFVSVSLIMVIICVAAFATIRWVLPRLIRSPLERKSGPFRILARYALEPRKAVYIVRVGKRCLLLGSTDHALNTLASFDEGDLPEEWRLSDMQKDRI